MLALIEGPTLADRITQGPIPVDEALSIAKQIAEAVLEGRVKDDPTNGSVSFNNTPFRGMKHHVKIGRHYFYRSRMVQVASGE